MAIEFCCLNCRNTLVAHDDDAGEKIECEKCGLRVTVPSPIGGELTNKRLRATKKAPPVSVRVAVEESGKTSTSDSGDLATEQLSDDQVYVPKVVEQRYFDLDKQPRSGFDISVTFPEEAMGKWEFELLVRTAAEIRRALVAYLEQDPNYFVRGGLVLVINRWRADQDGYDVNIRLVGLLNDIEVSHYFYLQRQIVDATGLQFGAIGVLIHSGVNHVRWSWARESCMKRFHRFATKQVIAELTRVFDETIGRPVSLWTLVSRMMSRNL